jgi:hypothetical protein
MLTNDQIASTAADARAAIDALDYCAANLAEIRALIRVQVACEQELDRRAEAARPERVAGYKGQMRGKRCRILNRAKPCSCGCLGQDPWHKAWFWRVVTVVAPGEGTVRMPYSRQPVRPRRRHRAHAVQPPARARHPRPAEPPRLGRRPRQHRVRPLTYTRLQRPRRMAGAGSFLENSDHG